MSDLALSNGSGWDVSQGETRLGLAASVTRDRNLMILNGVQLWLGENCRSVDDTTSAAVRGGGYHQAGRDESNRKRKQNKKKKGK